MQTSTRLGLLAGISSLLFASVMTQPGCVSSTTSPASDGADGGTIDAAVVDAGQVDAAIDVAVDAPVDRRGDVTVRVFQNGVLLPAAAAPVVFSEPDGKTTRVDTDINGEAKLSVLPDTAVTAVTEQYGQYRIETIRGVSPGDSITVNRRPFTDPAASVDVLFTEFGVDAGYTYRITAGCSGTTGIVGQTSSLTDVHCAGPSGLHVVVEAWDSFYHLAGTAARDVQPDADGGITQVSVGPDDWAAATQQHATVTAVDGLASTSGFVYYRQAGQGPYAIQSSGSPVDFHRPAAGQFELECVHAMAEGCAPTDGGPCNASRAASLECAAPATGDMTVLASPPPQIASFRVDKDSTGLPTVLWELAGPMPDGIAVVAEAQGYFVGEAGSVYVTWTVVQPAGTNSATPPALPESLAVALLDGTIAWGNINLAVYGSSTLTYGQFRSAPDEHVFAITDGSYGSGANMAAPAAPASFRYTRRTTVD